MLKASRFTIDFTGDVHVERVAPNGKVLSNPHLYLIMGPTGAGKSSFIESLAGKSLSISSSQLAPYTQTVTAYHLVNAWRDRRPIYLIDTPGFSDSRISELEIMDMVRAWLEHNNLQYFHNILYLIPINETRLPGSKRKTIEMLRNFIEISSDLSCIVFTTTMWDQLFNERTRKRGEANFAQLQDELLKDLLNEGSTIAKYDNTRASALEVLGNKFRLNFSFGNPGSYSLENLYINLHDHIANALGERKMHEADLAQLETADHETETQLRQILEERLEDVTQVLAKFIGQWLNFESHPYDVEGKAQHLHQEIMAANIPLERQCLERLRKWDIQPVHIWEARTARSEAASPFLPPLGEISETGYPKKSVVFQVTTVSGSAWDAPRSTPEHATLPIPQSTQISRIDLQTPPTTLHSLSLHTPLFPMSTLPSPYVPSGSTPFMASRVQLQTPPFPISSLTSDLPQSTTNPSTSTRRFETHLTPYLPTHSEYVVPPNATSSTSSVASRQTRDMTPFIPPSSTPYQPRHSKPLPVLNSVDPEAEESLVPFPKPFIPTPWPYMPHSSTSRSGVDDSTSPMPFPRPFIPMPWPYMALDISTLTSRIGLRTPQSPFSPQLPFIPPGSRSSSPLP